MQPGGTKYTLIPEEQLLPQDEKKMDQPEHSGKKKKKVKKGLVIEWRDV